MAESRKTFCHIPYFGGIFLNSMSDLSGCCETPFLARKGCLMTAKLSSGVTFQSYYCAGCSWLILLLLKLNLIEIETVMQRTETFWRVGG